MIFILFIYRILVDFDSELVIYGQHLQFLFYFYYFCYLCFINPLTLNPNTYKQVEVEALLQNFWEWCMATSFLDQDDCLCCFFLFWTCHLCPTCPSVCFTCPRLRTNLSVKHTKLRNWYEQYTPYKFLRKIMVVHLHFFLFRTLISCYHSSFGLVL